MSFWCYVATVVGRRSVFGRRSVSIPESHRHVDHQSFHRLSAADTEPERKGSPRTETFNQRAVAGTRARPKNV